ncbi:hypothetical protein PO909_009265 [Leuciscus waleckii]
MGEVRKLQKKLRQIENLEIKISLTPEEKIKVSKKVELRSRLAELLLQHSGPQQTQGIVGKEEDRMKRQVEEVTEQHVARPPALKIAREERRENDGSQTDGRGETHFPVSTSVEEQEDVQFRSRKQTWEKSKFRLRTLEGHSDIITCVVAVDNLVISGSRDTTVKVWHVPTATEQRNLGGHSGGVTCLSAPPPEYCRRLARAFDLADKERFVLSGSTDCCVRIWALSSGQCVKSIYTFNAVTSLCFIPEGEGFIVTGSGVMTRLTNHSSTAGVTDCVNQIPGLLIGSCFDLANGESKINHLPRILCYAAWLTASGDHRWVTGGRDLIVWEQLPGSFKKRGDVTVRRDSRLEDCLLESDRDSEDDNSEDDDEDSITQDASETEEPASSSWLRCVLHSISPHIGFLPLRSFLLVTVIFCTATGDTDDRKWEELGEMQMPVTAQASTTQLWAVDWGPTQPLEDETHHVLSSLETESLRVTPSQDWTHHRSAATNQTQRPTTGERDTIETEEPDTKEVDPQFYVTVTISSLLILTAVIISAKLW